jgi:hypothetical protein
VWMVMMQCLGCIWVGIDNDDDDDDDDDDDG